MAPAWRVWVPTSWFRIATSPPLPTSRWPRHPPLHRHLRRDPRNTILWVIQANWVLNLLPACHSKLSQVFPPPPQLWSIRSPRFFSFFWWFWNSSLSCPICGGALLLCCCKLEYQKNYLPSQRIINVELHIKRSWEGVFLPRPHCERPCLRWICAVHLPLSHWVSELEVAGGGAFFYWEGVGLLASDVLLFKGHSRGILFLHTWAVVFIVLQLGFLRIKMRGALSFLNFIDKTRHLSNRTIIFMFGLPLRWFLFLQPPVKGKLNRPTFLPILPQINTQFIFPPCYLPPRTQISRLVLYGFEYPWILDIGSDDGMQRWVELIGQGCKISAHFMLFLLEVYLSLQFDVVHDGPLIWIAKEVLIFYRLSIFKFF